MMIIFLKKLLEIIPEEYCDSYQECVKTSFILK